MQVFVYFYLLFTWRSKFSKIFKILSFSEPVMSVDLTWPTMKRSVELGARFLVKKPLDGNTINNMWQHLDLKFYWWEKIEYLFQGWS